MNLKFFIMDKIEWTLPERHSFLELHKKHLPFPDTCTQSILCSPLSLRHISLLFFLTYIYLTHGIKRCVGKDMCHNKKKETKQKKRNKKKIMLNIQQAYVWKSNQSFIFQNNQSQNPSAKIVTQAKCKVSSTQNSSIQGRNFRIFFILTKHINTWQDEHHSQALSNIIQQAIWAQTKKKQQKSRRIYAPLAGQHAGTLSLLSLFFLNPQP